MGCVPSGESEQPPDFVAQNFRGLLRLWPDDLAGISTDSSGIKHWRNIMISKYLAIAFLATASMTGAAAAQTATNQAASATSATTHKEGEWRASKLAGIDVYNEANEKIGDIHDVILDRSGRVANVILGVGGVLGLGEHYVAVAFDKLKWVDQPVTSTTASTTSPPGMRLQLLPLQTAPREPPPVPQLPPLQPPQPAPVRVGIPITRCITPPRTN